MTIIGITGQAGSGKDTVADHLVQRHGYVKIALADPIKRLGREVFGFTDDQLWGPSEKRNAHDKRYDYFCSIRPGGAKFGPKTPLECAAKDCNAGWYSAAKAFQAYADEWLADVLPGGDLDLLYTWFSALGNDYARLSPRIMLQLLGTEWGRQAADKNIWVNYMLRIANRVLEGEEYDRRVGLIGEAPGATALVGVIVSDVRFANELIAIKEAGGKLIRVRRPETDTLSSKTGIAGHPSEMEQKQFNDEDFNASLLNTHSLDELLESVDIIISSWGN